jgi:hypothetical protein
MIAFRMSEVSELKFVLFTELFSFDVSKADEDLCVKLTVIWWDTELMFCPFQWPITPVYPALLCVFLKM